MAITYTYVKANNGRRAAQKLREAQLGWIKKRDRECEAEAAPTPSTQQGRNFMSCMDVRTDYRTAELRAMVGKQ